ncbi:MAG: hypothetical protein NKF70_06110 [Methanobacterium sp. ERen5]|nr:MAG: hypothetical protein NKF70_06110 [Methanobacterium sp. ERen5]
MNENPFEILKQEFPEIAVILGKLVDAQKSLKGIDNKTKQFKSRHTNCKSKPHMGSDTCFNGKNLKVPPVKRFWGIKIYIILDLHLLWNVYQKS